MAQAPDRDSIVRRVLNEHTEKGIPTSYEVLFTAERVKLLLGATQASYTDALLNLLDEQTASSTSWVQSEEVARLAGAKIAVVGRPASLDQVRDRLLAALASPAP